MQKREANNDQTAETASNAPGPLVAGEDYYLEGGMMVFTAAYLLRRGYCCENGCRACPYEKAAPKVSGD
jgi:hypothetical protein